MAITMKAARINAGYKQTEAAEKLGVSPNTYLNWENGKTIPTVDRAYEICELFNLPIDSIIFLQK
ncbi:MAG: helix-turn-helix transcriptional regulator [Clostridiales bacterium]|nr:helix-turn-helix transcriptional regulator [Clostridiales bacterium]